jgi:hypothetical protein
MRPILRDLGNVAARTGAAIVIIGHMNKVERSKGIYRGLGSIDITAAARSVLLIGKRKNDTGTRFMTQIKNNLSAFGKAISFTINENGAVVFTGECDIAEEDLLVTTVKKQTKFQIAQGIITEMLQEGDRRSNEIYDTCLNAGVSGGVMQQVKRKLGVKSVHKADDWYWTLDAGAAYTEGEPIPEPTPEPIADDEDVPDEIPVAYWDEAMAAPVSPQRLVIPPFTRTMQSPYGELSLIDWRACV